MTFTASKMPDLVLCSDDLYQRLEQVVRDGMLSGLSLQEVLRRASTKGGNAELVIVGICAAYDIRIGCSPALEPGSFIVLNSMGQQLAIYSRITDKLETDWEVN